ncbi:MAG: hypothetical protein ACP5G1_03875 [Nanopusillaceae archaeon]
MIVQRFLVGYKKNPKLILGLYKEVYGVKKNSLSEEEIRKLHKDTIDLLENLLNNQDINDALVKFFGKIKQFKYSGYDIEQKYLILSSAVKHGRKNNEILKKYIDSKDNEKVAKIIDYLGRIVDITLGEENKLPSVYNAELKDPKELMSSIKEPNDVDENKIKDNNSGLKSTIYNFISSTGSKIRDIAVEIDKFFKKIAGYEYVRDFLKDLIDDILYIVVDYPKVVGLAGLMTLVMIYFRYRLNKLIKSDTNTLISNFKIALNKLSNLSILTSNFVKAGVKLSVMSSSVYLLKKIFNDLKQEHKKRYKNKLMDLYEGTEDALDKIEEKLSESGYRKLINLIKQKFGKGLLESPTVVTGLIKVIYAILWTIILFLTYTALLLSEVLGKRSHIPKIFGIIVALGFAS